MFLGENKILFKGVQSYYFSLSSPLNQKVNTLRLRGFLLNSFGMQAFIDRSLPEITLILSSDSLKGHCLHPLCPFVQSFNNFFIQPKYEKYKLSIVQLLFKNFKIC